ncbi:conserved hypothetical protein [Candidatus Desulfarcum epimagneticum]|uniref:Uncharacterized protein n=1 Tax=uncultured Desulfobacteraceae bacterium TaxID=218296 RepID=A0A484HHU7_9BACT|nr:conserved hypothetical protein [uncultured Desulfobacteraceae bacterium]
MGADGKTVMDETVQTLKNGFLDIWLPRDQRFMVTISGMDREARGVIETFSESKTCVTTFRLE